MIKYPIQDMDTCYCVIILIYTMLAQITISKGGSIGRIDRVYDKIPFQAALVIKFFNIFIPAVL